MVKKNIITGIVIGALLLVVLLNGPFDTKEGKKLAGETVDWTPSTNEVQLGTTMSFLVLPSSTSEIKSWTAEGIIIPSGWSLSQVSWTGGNGLGADGCAVEGNTLNCATAGSTPAAVRTGLAISFNAPSSEFNPITFSGMFTTTATDDSVNSGSLSDVIITAKRNCGTGPCSGSQLYNGGWGDCNTIGRDCGICSLCDASGNCNIYDETQDQDCSSSDCPSDGCGVGGCLSTIFGDYPTSITNECQSLGQCTSNFCTVTCSIDNDADGYAGGAFGTECYDCNDVPGGPGGLQNPGLMELCNTGIDENCDGSELIGRSDCGIHGSCNPLADLDCDQSYSWTEFRNFLTAWGTGDSASYQGTIGWSDLKAVLLWWATN